MTRRNPVTLIAALTLLLAGAAVAQPTGVAAPHEVGSSEGFALGRRLAEADADTAAIADAFGEVWTALAERYKDDPVASFDARLALIEHVINLQAFQLAGALMKPLLLEGASLPGQPGPFRRALYMQGVLGWASMIAGGREINQRSANLISQGRALIRDAAGQERMGGAEADWLNALWSSIEPAPIARLALIERACDGADARGDHALVMAAAFNGASRGLPDDATRPLLDRAQDAAEALKRRRDATAIALFTLARFEPDSAEVPDLARTLLGLLNVDDDRASADLGLLVVMAGLLQPVDAAIALEFAEKAAGIVDDRPGTPRGMRDAVLLARARLMIAAGLEPPEVPGLPDPARHLVDATPGFKMPVTPWDIGRDASLTAELRVIALPAPAAEAADPAP